MILGAVIVAFGVAALLYAEATDRPGLRWTAKPLASAGFLLAALDAPAFRLPTGVGWLLFGALVLSAIGDVLLVPKSKAAFIAGIAAFALAHIAFSAWFLTSGLNPVVLAVAVAAMLVVGHLVWTWLDPHLTGAMRAAVRVYVLLVSLMTAFAVAFGAHAIIAGSLRAALPALGGVLFCVSDVAVARHRFVAPAFINRAWGLPVYYTAQLLLASALLAT